MLGISIEELLVVGIVGMLVLGPKEMVRIIKSLRDIFNTVRESYEEFTNYLKKEIGDDEDSGTHIVIGEDGVPREAFDVAKIKPYLHNKEEE